MTNSATNEAATTMESSAVKLDEHIVEIVSDSGEGAQKCGQTFGAVSGKMGNGVWTVEIIPAEIQPPARSPAGASGIRIRLGSKYVTNKGNEADLVVAFNEQVLYSRIANGAYKNGTVVLLDNKWENDPQQDIRDAYAKAVVEFRENGLIVHELPMDEECKKTQKKRKNWERRDLRENIGVRAFPTAQIGILIKIWSKNMYIKVHGRPRCDEW